MKSSDIEKYADKIDFCCCDHKSNRNKYLLGYTGLKCCKVAMCLDCDNVQFVGGTFGKLLYSISKVLSRNRFEIVETIELVPFDLTED